MTWYDKEEYIKEFEWWNNPERCRTCQGMSWNVRLGKFVYSRETVGLVCETCGWDYNRGEKPHGIIPPPAESP
jgi:hypothetical protein